MRIVDADIYRASSELGRPFRRQRLGLLQYVLHRRILQVRRIAVLAEIGPRRVPVHPIDGVIGLDDSDKLLSINRSVGSAITCRALSFSASAS